MTKLIQIDKTRDSNKGNISYFKLIVKRYKNNVKSSFAGPGTGDGIILNLVKLSF